VNQINRYLALALIVAVVALASAALAAEPIPEPYREAVAQQNAHTFNRNALTAFVYNTFYQFDKHVPVEQFLHNLVDKDLNMQFPEATLKSHDEFKKWYAGIGENIKSNTHTVQSVEPRVSEDGKYSVHVIVFWQAETVKGEYLKFTADQQWTLVDDQGRLKIKDYIVKPAK